MLLGPPRLMPAFLRNPTEAKGVAANMARRPNNAGARATHASRGMQHSTPTLQGNARETQACKVAIATIGSGARMNSVSSGTQTSLLGAVGKRRAEHQPIYAEEHPVLRNVYERPHFMAWCLKDRNQQTRLFANAPCAPSHTHIQ